jgi:hypothetical protein
MTRCLLAASLLALAFPKASFAGDADDAASTIRREELRAHIEFLASDELEGRGTLQRGNDVAARYLASEMRRVGLSPGGPDGSFFQEVPLWVSSYKYTYFLELRFRSPSERQEFEAFKHFTVAPGSGHDTVEGDVVFAGYGITAPEYGWDDYAGVDAAGKAVVVLRHEPRENDEKSPWEGRKMTKHATFEAKIENARRHGAAALVIMNDPLGGHEPLFESADLVPDTMVHRTEIGFEKGGEPRISPGGMPVVFVTMETACGILHKEMEELAAIQKEMDASGKPAPFQVVGSLKVRTQLAGRLQTTERKVARNVAGVLPGADPARMSEVIVVGAHFDHLGTYGSGDDTIFNGADDNASGTAGLLEIAEAFCRLKERPARTLLFLAFTGEEIGLLGSRWFVDHPLFPLENTVAMINLDMIGRDGNDSAANAKAVIAAGANTSPLWRELLTLHGADSGLDVQPSGEDPGGSDHQPFRDRRVPVLFFFTGFHKDYHRVSDHADRIRFDKVEAVSRLAFRVASDLAARPDRPEFTDPKDARPERVEQAGAIRHGDALILRQLTEEEARRDGLDPSIRGMRVVLSKREDLKEGDVILEVGDEPCPDAEEFLRLLKERKGGSASLFVQRGKARTFFVHLKGAELEGWKPGAR